MTNKTSHPQHLQRLAYRPDIDGLRAIAILSVMAFHLFPEWVDGGFIGVDIFFVISGFLISSIILNRIANNDFDFTDFYCRRINRIFPALLLILVTSFGAGWFLLFTDLYNELCKHIAGAAVFSTNFLLLNESRGGYFDGSSKLKPLLHLWSLSIEEQFYLCWPLLLTISWKLNKLKGVSIAIWIIIAISFLLSTSIGGTSYAFYFPIPRFWELMVGSLLACIAIKEIKSSNKLNNAQSFLGLFFLGASFVYINEAREFPGFWVLLPVVATALLISSGPTAWINKNILAGRFLVWSYQLPVIFMALAVIIVRSGFFW